LTATKEEQTVRAAVFTGPGRIAVEEIPAPVAQPHDVIVAVSACGICGSDLGFYTHGGDLVQPGQVMGHEFAGERCKMTGAGSGV
jgi:threonine dehydrogenase-like Zn-dependent dehydrogenase